MPPTTPRRKWVLLNPGPVNVTPAVRRALLKPDICHREEEFSDLLRGVRSKLLRAFGIANTHVTALFTGSGTLAVEAMLSSYGDARTKILVLSNGVYGQRMAQILRAHRIPHDVLESPIVSFPSLSEIEARLKRDTSIRAIAMVHHETSTGSLNPVDAVARLAEKHGKRLLVDAVSSLGAEKINLKRIDFCAGTAGKCLHAFPGVAFVFLSKRALGDIHKKEPSTVYLDLASAVSSQNSGVPAFTPAVQLFYAFDAALNELLKEGVAQRIRHYAQKSALLQKGLEKQGLKLLIAPNKRSHVLTSAWLPPLLKYDGLHDALKKDSFVIYAGQLALKDKIFRVAHLGDVRVEDLKKLLHSIKKIIADLRKNLPTVVLLAAGAGRRLGGHTQHTPKCLIPLKHGGPTLLERYFQSFQTLGLKDVVIVCGHEHRQIRRAAKKLQKNLNVRFIYNKDYRKGSVLSLYKASACLDRDVLIMDADVFFPVEALERLLLNPMRSAFLMDEKSTSSGEEMMLMAKKGRLYSISKTIDRSLSVSGEATGILKLGKKDALLLRKILRDFFLKKNWSVEYEETYSRLLKTRPIGAVGMDGLYWKEIDFEEDLMEVARFLSCHAQAKSPRVFQLS